MLANGPFKVRVEVFGSDLVYREGEHKLTLPVDFGWAGGCVVVTGAIRRWDGSSDTFDKGQIATIERNIFAALEHLQIRYLNAS